MKTIRLSVACIALAAAQLAAAAGVYIPRQVHVNRPLGTQASTLTRTSSSLVGYRHQILNPAIKVTPDAVLSFEPASHQWVAIPRLRAASLLAEPDTAQERLKILRKLLETGTFEPVVEQRTLLVDPAWIEQHRDRSVIFETPRLYKWPAAVTTP